MATITGQTFEFRTRTNGAALRETKEVSRRLHKRMYKCSDMIPTCLLPYLWQWVFVLLASFLVKAWISGSLPRTRPTKHQKNNNNNSGKQKGQTKRKTIVCEKSKIEGSLQSSRPLEHLSRVTCGRTFRGITLGPVYLPRTLARALGITVVGLRRKIFFSFVENKGRKKGKVGARRMGKRAILGWRRSWHLWTKKNVHKGNITIRLMIIGW